MIVCITCGESKDLDSFLLTDTVVSGVSLAKECKDCRSERNHEALKTFVLNNSSVRKKAKTALLDKEQYNKLFIRQDGRCVICKVHQSELKRRLSIDHDHKTGKVRGLLCNNCNVALGLIKEDTLALENMITYIKRNST